MFNWIKKKKSVDLDASALLNALTMDHSHNVRWARQEDADQSFADFIEEEMDIDSLRINVLRKRRKR